MTFNVYILHSKTIDRFYVGQTKNLRDRLNRHNSRKVSSTRRGAPWTLVWSVEKQSRAKAMILEKKIKGRGAERFLKDLEYES